ncbi:unnamed protein product, partial [Heterotrigona itama]
IVTSTSSKFKLIIKHIPKINGEPTISSQDQKSIKVSTERDLENTEQDTPLRVLKSTYFPILLDFNLSKNSSDRISRPEVSQNFSKNTPTHHRRESHKFQFLTIHWRRHANNRKLSLTIDLGRESIRMTVDVKLPGMFHRRDSSSLVSESAPPHWNEEEEEEEEEEEKEEEEQEEQEDEDQRREIFSGVSAGR